MKKGQGRSPVGEDMTLGGEGESGMAAGEIAEHGGERLGGRK